MIQLKLIDKDGNTIQPQDLTTVADLSEAVDRARALVRECERLARQMGPQKAVVRAPYS
jgi:hypothetical protein